MKSDVTRCLRTTFVHGVVGAHEFVSWAWHDNPQRIEGYSPPLLEASIEVARGKNQLYLVFGDKDTTSRIDLSFHRWSVYVWNEVEL